MGSCVSKKAARAGAGTGAKGGKVAAPLPVVEENANVQLPPVLEVEEEEVKEVVLSETPVPRPPKPPPEPVKRRREQPEADDEAAVSETCSASDSAASVASAAKEKAKEKKVHEDGGEREVEKRAVDAPEKAKTTARRTTAPEERERDRESRKPKGGSAGGVNGHGRARSPSPLSAHRRQQQSGGQGQQQHPPARRPQREQPAVVSGIGCRSGQFSPSAARRAAESAAAVRRTPSAREADMALSSSSSKRCLLSLNSNVAAGHGGGSASALSRRDPGERSGRRSDSPTGSRRAVASPSAAIHRSASPMRKSAAKEHGTPERARPPPRVVRDCGLGGREQRAAALGGGGVGGERRSWRRASRACWDRTTPRWPWSASSSSRARDHRPCLVPLSRYPLIVVSCYLPGNLLDIIVASIIDGATPLAIAAHL